MEKYKYIHVVGYGWSGSSAIIDLLKEYDNIYVPNLEFRLIKERYGLMNLETMLTEQWDPIETDIALKDFIWLTRKLNERISKYYIHFGHCYSQTIGKHFLDVTDSFIKQIVSYEFKSNWHFFYWKLNTIKRMYYWFRKRCRLSDYTENMFFASPVTKDEFEEYTKEYIDNLFRPIISDSNKFIVLDQGVPAQYPEYAFKYTNNAKVIVIDRDPRDVYVDLVNCKELIGAELAKKDNAKIFIEWYKALHFRKDFVNKNDVLFIRFEDIINNYEKTVESIEVYLGIKNIQHLHIKEYFNPQISKKNMGLWKEYKNQEVMKEIKVALAEYCYEK